MASVPIISEQVDGEKIETVTVFTFLGIQNHCGWWLQPWNSKTLASWKKSYDKPRQCIKQRHHIVNKGLYCQGYGFSSNHVQTWELDNKDGRTSTNWRFSTEVLEKTLESPLQARRSNQSILKEINSEYSLEGLMLKLKLQYFGHLIWTADLGKTLMLGKIEGRIRRGQQRMRQLNGITNSMGMNLGKLWEMVIDGEACHVAIHRVANSWTWFGDWTTTARHLGNAFVPQ